MTPKEKAIELVDKFYDYVNCWDNDGANYTQAYIYGKECALIAVDEIIKVINPENWGLEMDSAFESIDYWQKVKQEIESLK